MFVLQMESEWCPKECHFVLMLRLTASVAMQLDAKAAANGDVG